MLECDVKVIVLAKQNKPREDNYVLPSLIVLLAICSPWPTIWWLWLNLYDCHKTVHETYTTIYLCHIMIYVYSLRMLYHFKQWRFMFLDEFSVIMIYDLCLYSIWQMIMNKCTYIIQYCVYDSSSHLESFQAFFFVIFFKTLTLYRNCMNMKRRIMLFKANISYYHSVIWHNSNIIW